LRPFAAKDWITAFYKGLPIMTDDLHDGLIHLAMESTPVPFAPFRGDIFALCDVVRETGFAVHKWFRHGHLEKVYENSLAHRLRKQGIYVRQQYPLPVFDEDGTKVGDYFADLLVDERLILEIKACKTLAEEHAAQILGYLRASNREHGLLLNFGAPRFQIKKWVLSRDGTHSG
jgi:GxxExxY protein